jgi:hypothetical protein
MAGPGQSGASKDRGLAGWVRQRGESWDRKSTHGERGTGNGERKNGERGAPVLTVLAVPIVLTIPTAGPLPGHREDSSPRCGPGAPCAAPGQSRDSACLVPVLSLVIRS